MMSVRYALILSCSMLAACGSLLPEGKQPPRIFLLDVPTAVARPQGAALPFNLQIIEPITGPGLDTDRIALRKNTQEMDYFADARWSSSLPLMVQSQLVEQFESANLRSVGSDLVQFNADTVLAVEIRDFQAEYEGINPTAHVRLVARLIRSPEASIISSRIYEEREPAKANRMHEVVEAYNIAFNRAAQRMVTDTASQLGAMPPVPPAAAEK